jgi:hypothetical protein
MANETDISLSKAIELKKARLAEQAVAIERELAELAELERLAAKHNLVVSAAAKPDLLALVPEPSPSRPPAPATQALGLPPFPGSFDALLLSYRTHPDSPYHNLKFRVRNSYDYILNRASADMGPTWLPELDADRIMSLYNSWAAGGRYALGHSLVGKLRLVFSFGMIVLKDEQATRLSVIMSKLRFKIPEARTERLTSEHVQAIRDAAHRHFGWHSIALAQTLQFELMLKQTDVIGEWVPLSEPGTSDILRGDEKWVRGLRWSNINDNWILRHTILSGRRNEPKEIEIDLKQAPMVREELAQCVARSSNGPIVLNEVTGLPWSLAEFRRKWRMVANEAGIPVNVKNMDSGKSDKPIARTLPSGRIRVEGQ